LTSPVGSALDWLAERLHPPGDAVLRGLEHDLSRETTLDGAWRRICETAWALGFVELRLVPEPGAADLLGDWHAFAPRPWPSLNGRPNAQSTWAFALTRDGRPLASVSARRRLGRVDFEPTRFVAALQGALDRFVRPSSGQ
jgi:hypothetical protein